MVVGIISLAEIQNRGMSYKGMNWSKPEHRVYGLGNYGHVYTTYDDKNNSKKKGDMAYKEGDIMEIKYDSQEHKLTFRINSTATLDIPMAPTDVYE